MIVLINTLLIKYQRAWVHDKWQIAFSSFLIRKNQINKLSLMMNSVQYIKLKQTRN